MDEQLGNLGTASDAGPISGHGAGAQVAARESLRPKVGLIVETADARGGVISRERFDVVRPAGPVRQHEQLVQAVTRRLPDARISSAAGGCVTFLCRGYLVTSAYEDALERAPVELSDNPP